MDLPTLAKLSRDGRVLMFGAALLVSVTVLVLARNRSSKPSATRSSPSTELTKSPPTNEAQVTYRLKGIIAVLCELGRGFFKVQNDNALSCILEFREETFRSGTCWFFRG
jgi:hypothetical protein